mmetsp:Transcript_161/g.520  ORF Transcript_161/g.520 Transcript_161/m.520 type:complete len:128 (-) Transcript_161:95-478(-)
MPGQRTRSGKIQPISKSPMSPMASKLGSHGRRWAPCEAQRPGILPESCGKGDGLMKIGLDIMYNGSVSLGVKKVKEGLVSEWNKEYPQTTVCPGDVISEVNGCHGSPEKLLERIAYDRILNLTISRP